MGHARVGDYLGSLFAPWVHSPHHHYKNKYQHYAHDHEVSEREPRALLRLVRKVTPGLITSEHTQHVKRRMPELEGWQRCPLM
jgi:hypothetical protein